MQRPISGVAASAHDPAAASVMPSPWYASVSASFGVAAIPATAASPSGDCHTWAMSCHTYSGSAQPAMSVTHERIRSGRDAARRCT